jgi:signal transduction histidine kinase
MRHAAYWAVVAGAFVLALVGGWTSLGSQVDNDLYDFLFRARPRAAAQPDSVIYGIDERTLAAGGGLRRMRTILADGLERLAACDPAVVIVDLILADSTEPEEDARLARALGRLPKVVLASALIPGGWDDPLPGLPRAAVGHVHADPDPFDNVVRKVALEKSYGPVRRWALSLEALRALDPGMAIEESPGEIRIGEARLVSRQRDGRPMLIHFLPPENPIPQISFSELAANEAAGKMLRGRAVFVGLTAQSAAQDRHMTPYSFGQTMVGVEIHAHAFETLRSRAFLRNASHLETVALAFGFSLAAGLVFSLFSGWTAYLLAAGLLVSAHIVPFAAFGTGVVMPYTTPLLAVWLATGGAASFQYFATRRRLRKAESDKERYQQAMHFVAHEMRSPLTAIQGSSELMGRYSLPEAKRAEMAKMINAESKRMARMIQTFLDVERLSEGEMELRREPVPAADLVDVCLERARPLAENKRIQLVRDEVAEAWVLGDQELMEYALYNLINNAIKYSPRDTAVRVGGLISEGRLRLFVRDQGIGMDEREAAQIFQKFYRTKRAEASGEAGTGIGLSIVDQIVANHGGKMEVESAPGAGSCFTMNLPVAEGARELNA